MKDKAKNEDAAKIEEVIREVHPDATIKTGYGIDLKTFLERSAVVGDSGFISYQGRGKSMTAEDASAHSLVDRYSIYMRYGRKVSNEHGGYDRYSELCKRFAKGRLYRTSEGTRQLTYADALPMFLEHGVDAFEIMVEVQ